MGKACPFSSSATQNLIIIAIFKLMVLCDTLVYMSLTIGPLKFWFGLSSGVFCFCVCLCCFWWLIFNLGAMHAASTEHFYIVWLRAYLYGGRDTWVPESSGTPGYLERVRICISTAFDRKMYVYMACGKTASGRVACLEGSLSLRDWVSLYHLSDPTTPNERKSSI